MECYPRFSKDMMQQPCEAQSVYDFFTNWYSKTVKPIDSVSDILKVARLLDEAGIVVYVSLNLDFPFKWCAATQFWFVRTVDILEKDPDLWTVEETEKCLEAVFSNTGQAVLVDYYDLRDMILANKLHKIAIYFGVWNNGL